MSTILIVDDDQTQRLISKHALSKVADYVLEEACDGVQALSRLMDTSRPLVDLILLDHFMPNMDGATALKHIRETYPTIPVIIVTANNELDDAVRFMRDGATDFITKPFSPERLRLSIAQNLTIRTLSNEVARLTRKERGQGQFSDLIGSQGGLSAAITMGRKAAGSDISVLIHGESGTGKELFARAIHGESHRTGHAFVAINCGAIPENLVESALFGHEKGSFTGAIAREIGKFREAEGGTLFLDEVGELKPDMQTKLLRVLQQKEVQPVGSSKPVPVNVRIISATHRNLAEDVQAGRFREDLYYRLNVLPIRLPTLAERREDIPALVEHLLQRISVAERKPPISTTPKGMEWLCRQPWPGNVRELENLLYRAVVLSDSNALTDADLIAMTSHSPAAAPPAGSDHYVLLLDDQKHPRTLEELEADIIAAAMRRCQNNVADAAKSLGMGQSTLYKKLSGKDAAA